jgi:hypothetical protein
MTTLDEINSIKVMIQKYKHIIDQEDYAIMQTNIVQIKINCINRLKTLKTLQVLKSLKALKT